MEDVVLVVLFSVLRFLDALGILAFINCWKEQMRKRQDCWIARRLWMCFIIIKLRIWRHVLNESISSYLYMRYICTGDNYKYHKNVNTKSVFLKKMQQIVISHRLLLSYIIHLGIRQSTFILNIYLWV